MQTVWLLHLFLRKKNSVNEVINAVVIDDNEKDVWAVTNALGIKGIATFPIHYSEANKAFDYCRGIASSQPRVIITDIQINNSPGKDPTITDYSNIASCIEFLVSEVSGPYIVLAWTDQSSHLEELKGYVMKYLEKKKIIKPLYFEAICKVECREEGSDMVYSMEKIFSKFSLHMEQEKGIRALMSWEKLVAKSAHETVNSLVNMAGDNLTDVLYSLGYQVAGKNLQKNECAALNESLFYILRDELAKLSETDDNNALWSEALFGGSNAHVSSLKHQLNTLLHIDKSVISATICPGDVWKINNDQLFRKLTMQKQAKTLQKEFKKEIITWSTEGFELKKLFDSHDKTEPEYGALRERLKTEFTDPQEVALEGSLTIAIEVSPQCDFSNKKKKLKTLILGMLIPVGLLSENIVIKKADALISMPINYEGDNYYLVLSAKYLLSLSELQIKHADIGMGKIFRVRENMLQSWIQSISSYNARIGTISFH
jgi:hypothetical protein